MDRLRLTVLVTALAVLSAVPTASVAAQTSSTAAQVSSLQRAIDRGKAMYSYDRAAWVTSDDATARIPLDRLTEVGGWIVTPLGRDFHVDFFGKDAAADRVIYAADVSGDTVKNAIVYPVTSEPALKAPALQMARALRAARSEISRHPDWQPCTNAPFNTIVLPPESDGITPVYFLTPQTETGRFPFGGHYEIDIAADGRTASTRAFTRSCITMTKPVLGAGETPTMLFLTHVLDAQPTESEVKETRQALDAELGRDLAAFDYRYRNKACTKERLSELRRWADSLAKGRVPPLKHEIEEPAFFAIRTASWEITDGEIASRIPVKAKLSYAGFYDGLKKFDQAKSDESRAWSTSNSNGRTHGEELAE